MTATLQKPGSFEFTETLLRRGTDFFHPEIVGEALGIKLPEVPPHRFSEEELAQAKELGDQLIWFPAKDLDGRPITMKRIYDQSENKAPLGGKLLYDTDWYAGEPFFTEATAGAGKSRLGQWRLVGQQAVPNTKVGNYLQQTIIGAKYVSEVIYGGNPSDHLKPILAEPAKREAEIAKLMNEDWEKAAEILANLPFNQFYRETPVEALIRVIINQEVNKIRLLESEYSWTNIRSRGGGLAFGTGSSGACLDDWVPGRGGDPVGFFLSRSESAESES